MGKPTITCWFSCGAASAVAAKKTIELYGNTHQIRVVNNPVAEEHPDNRRFLRDVQEWLGTEIETATNSRYPGASAVEVWEQRKFMSSVHGAPCTLELKKMARAQFEIGNPSDFIVLGFTAEEKGRIENFQVDRPDLVPILYNLGLSKNDCFLELISAGIKLPEIYRLGFPNANCIGCPKATSPTYWNLVREHFPEVFHARAEMSRKLGAKLVRVKGERIYLDELDPSARGAALKSFECGIFCPTQGDDD